MNRSWRVWNGRGVGPVTGLLVLLATFSNPAHTQIPTLEEGREQLDAGRWGRAISTFRWLTRDQPGNGEAFMGLAEGLVGKGDSEAALEALTAAAMLPRVAPRALYRRGCLLSDQGDTDGALESLDHAMRSGFSDRAAMSAEPALVRLRADPRFRLPSGHEERSLVLPSGETLRYLLVLPPHFQASRAYPVLVALGPGTQTLAAATFVLDNFVGEQAAQLGWVVAAPEAPAAGWLDADGGAAFGALLGELSRRFRVEGDRLHLMGNGNGAYTALALAPGSVDRLQSVTAVSGAPPPGGLHELASLTVRLYVGERDGVWITSVRTLHQALESVGGDVQTEILAGEGRFLNPLAGAGLMVRLEGLRQQ